MKTVEQIKNEYAKEQGYKNWSAILFQFQDDFNYASPEDENNTMNWIEYHEKAVIQLIQDELKKYQAEQINMYKECLELFLPTDKWDEATLFLSTYGSGLAKDLSNKENIK